MKRLVVLVFAACEGGRSPDPMPIELVDEGMACMEGRASGSFAADQPVTVTVDWNVCLSSSCTDDKMASCTVTVADRTVTIETRASWLDTSAAGQGCTDDCGLLQTSCETPPLAAGVYTFVLDGRSVTITVPSTVPVPPCIP